LCHATIDRISFDPNYGTYIHKRTDMSSTYFALIDTLADQRFSGNPAGVCILDTPVPDELMQKFAMEVNQAETAFLLPLADSWSLRWFTPVCEVDLCGHATMAAAVALWRHFGGKDRRINSISNSQW
jgi:PhzF family phenazine biosynthesis protein